MALRCPRCRENEMVLETFGVFQCPACGRIDADGKSLDPASRASLPANAPTATPVLFAPPPPSSPGAGGSAGARSAEEMAARGGPPSSFFMMLGLMLLLTLVTVAVSHDWCFLVGRAVTIGLLASGRPWSRFLSIFASAVECILIVVIVSAAYQQLSAFAVLLFGLLAVGDAFWVYVLFQPSTVRYFHPKV